jgi:hypothetical protein
MGKLLILVNIPRREDLEPIFVVVPNHVCVGLPLFGRVEERRTSRAHGPDLVGPLLAPGENVRGLPPKVV